MAAAVAATLKAARQADVAAMAVAAGVDQEEAEGEIAEAAAADETAAEQAAADETAAVEAESDERAELEATTAGAESVRSDQPLASEGDVQEAGTDAPAEVDAQAEAGPDAEAAAAEAAIAAELTAVRVRLAELDEAIDAACAEEDYERADELESARRELAARHPDA